MCTIIFHSVENSSVQIGSLLTLATFSTVIPLCTYFCFLVSDVKAKSTDKFKKKKSKQPNNTQQHVPTKTVHKTMGQSFDDSALVLMQKMFGASYLLNDSANGSCDT